MDMLSSVLSAVLAVTGVGIVGAVILVIASKFLAVQEDPRIGQVQECLPGANCGACGYAGCADYAKAIVESDAPLNKCIPGGQKAADAAAAVMGKDAGSAGPARKAVVACQGSADRRGFKYRYEGIHSCTAVNMLYSGPPDCRFGCLGYGDCTAVCKFDAIHVENGVAEVDPDKCTGCGMCANICPDKIIHIVPETDAPMVFCANRDRGAVTRKNCSIGCIGCGKCVRTCPVGAITMENNLAYIDMEKCTHCHACVAVCPVHAINLPKHSAGYQPVETGAE